MYFFKEVPIIKYFDDFTTFLLIRFLLKHITVNYQQWNTSYSASLQQISMNNRRTYINKMMQNLYKQSV